MRPIDVLRAAPLPAVPVLVASTSMPLVWLGAVEFGARGVEPLTLAVLARIVLQQAMNLPRLGRLLTLRGWGGATWTGIFFAGLGPALVLIWANSGAAAQAVWTVILVGTGLVGWAEAVRDRPDRGLLAAHYPALADRPDLAPKVLAIHSANQVLFGLTCLGLALVAAPGWWVLHAGWGWIAQSWVVNGVIVALYWGDAD